MWTDVTYLLGIAVLALVALVTAGRLWRRRGERKRQRERGVRRCKCGYDLRGLEVPRCPECGRMTGFDQTPAELGITEEEMREAAARRKAGL